MLTARASGGSCELFIGGKSPLLRINSDDLYRAEIRCFLCTGGEVICDCSFGDITINPEFFYDPAE